MKQYIPLIIGKSLNTLALVAPDKAAQIALDIFCKPRKGRVKPHQESYLNSFDRETIQGPHGSIAVYRKHGSGPRILLCHGWESNSFRWRKLTAYLEDQNLDLDILMMDAPGHGASEPEIFNAVMYKESMYAVAAHFKPEIMIGHSVGAFSMTLLFQDYPLDFVKKCILMAPPDTLELITRNYFDMLGLNQRVRKSYDALIAREFPHPVSYYNASDFAKSIDVSGVLIHDVLDDINQYFEGEAVVNNWAEGQLITTEGLGHSLQSKAVFESIVNEINVLAN